MVAVYQLIFFLALGLLAVVITVYVLAVSLLGRAIRMAIEEQERINAEYKRDTRKSIEKIQTELSKANAEDRSPDIKRLSRELSRMKRKRWLGNQKLMWIKMRPKLLGSIWGAFIPGVLFLSSASMSILALYKGDGTPEVSPYMWIAIATIVVGICFICISLKVTEGVAITSEEVAFKRDVEIFRTALVRFEEEKKSRLQLELIDKQQQFKVEVNSEIEIVYAVSLTQGEYADDIQIIFFAPQGFSFPGHKTVVQPEDHANVPGYVAAPVKIIKTLVMELAEQHSAVIKAPSEPGEYICYYRVLCRSSRGNYEEFKIVVEKKRGC